MQTGQSGCDQSQPIKTRGSLLKFKKLNGTEIKVSGRHHLQRGQKEETLGTGSRPQRPDFSPGPYKPDAHSQAAPSRELAGLPGRGRAPCTDAAPPHRRRPGTGSPSGGARSWRHSPGPAPTPLGREPGHPSSEAGTARQAPPTGSRRPPAPAPRRPRPLAPPAAPSHPAPPARHRAPSARATYLQRPHQRRRTPLHFRLPAPALGPGHVSARGHLTRKRLAGAGRCGPPTPGLRAFDPTAVRVGKELLVLGCA